MVLLVYFLMIVFNLFVIMKNKFCVLVFVLGLVFNLINKELEMLKKLNVILYIIIDKISI